MKKQNFSFVGNTIAVKGTQRDTIVIHESRLRAGGNSLNCAVLSLSPACRASKMACGGSTEQRIASWASLKGRATYCTAALLSAVRRFRYIAIHL
jgi:hypothetical protein